jgi:hypothetical protein
MTGRERRDRDPALVQELLARLARIKAVKAARETLALRERWTEQTRDNVIEAIYLGHRLDPAREAKNGQRER